MCGVFGYVGDERDNLSTFLVDGLAKLEYRGYDSAGIAVLANGRTKIFKQVGEIKNLKKLLNGITYSGNVGLGHTRWATHGKVTKKNAHPHTDCTGKIVVIHNGIIENFESLKNNLIKKGHKFATETDTEVFAHLIEENLKTNPRFTDAVRHAFDALHGLNAVVSFYRNREIVAFRRGSPLVAGVDARGSYISSDIPALVSITDKIVLLDEGQGALLTKSGVFRINLKTGKITQARTTRVKMQEVLVDKGSFAHFLLKEIYEQPEVIMRVTKNARKDIRHASTLIKNALGTYFTACGTAAHATLAATYMFSEIAKTHVNFALGSEFPYFEDFLIDRSLLIAASQSGETMDTLEAVRAAKRHKSKVLALVNVPGSTLERLSDYVIHLKAGPERSVLSTKAYIAKLALFLLFAYTSSGSYVDGVKLLEKTSKKMSEMFKGGLEKSIKRLARKLASQEHIYIIGRGVNYATALEGALKIKEASYIHAEGFAGGELKHGVIALIEKGTPCIAIVTNDRAHDAVLSNAMELASRGGYIIGISPRDESVFDYWIPVPDVKTASPLVSVVPMQLLAYHLATMRGYNPDKPRNLAKSVTVK